MKPLIFPWATRIPDYHWPSWLLVLLTQKNSNITYEILFGSYHRDFISKCHTGTKKINKISILTIYLGNWITAASFTFGEAASVPIATSRRNEPVSLYCKFFKVIVYVFGLNDTKKQPGNKIFPPVTTSRLFCKFHILMIFSSSRLAVFVLLIYRLAIQILCPAGISIKSHFNFKLLYFTPWTFCFFRTTWNSAVTKKVNYYFNYCTEGI